jgi:hypothetical protein
MAKAHIDCMEAKTMESEMGNLYITTETGFGEEYTAPALASFFVGRDVFSVTVYRNRIRTIRHDGEPEAFGNGSVVYGTEINEIG